MQAIGERLREARMRQGVDISEVEAATKIRAKYLRALENDEFGMLPGPTYVKSFLRTYAGYLGLDAHLLVEEYRSQHEPDGELEQQPFAPTAPRAPERMPRGGGGSPIGPGTAIVIAVVGLLVIFAIIGLASGGGKKKPAASAPAEKRKGHKKAKPRQRPPAKRRKVTVRVVPQGPTYVCADNGKGTKLFEGTIAAGQTFHGRPRLRLNLGRSAVTVTFNGKRVKIPGGSSSVGLSFTQSGRVVQLPPGNRPCA